VEKIAFYLTSGGVSWIEEFAALNGVALLVDLLDTKLKIFPKLYGYFALLSFFCFFLPSFSFPFFHFFLSFLSFLSGYCSRLGALKWTRPRFASSSLPFAALPTIRTAWRL
jgi:hypothetical protein